MSFATEFRAKIATLKMEAEEAQKKRISDCIKWAETSVISSILQDMESQLRFKGSIKITVPSKYDAEDPPISGPTITKIISAKMKSLGFGVENIDYRLAPRYIYIDYTFT